MQEIIDCFSKIQWDTILIGDLIMTAVRVALIFLREEIRLRGDFKRGPPIPNNRCHNCKHYHKEQNIDEKTGEKTVRHICKYHSKETYVWEFCENHEREE